MSLCQCRPLYQKFIAVALLTAFLAACGGGGGGGSPTSAGTSTIPVSTTLTVTGTAATGLAISGAIVNGKCKAGTGTATTQTDGSYNLVVTNGQLPCVLQVTNPADNTKLHTVVTGTGSTATANITPLTEMATARVLGSEPNVLPLMPQSHHKKLHPPTSKQRKPRLVWFWLVRWTRQRWATLLLRHSKLPPKAIPPAAMLKTGCLMVSS